MQIPNTLLIAEAGVNHNGNSKIAKKLIDVAAKSGADVVKFQSFKADELVSKTAPKAAYQAKNTGKNDGQYKMLKQLELTVNDLKDFITYAHSKNIVCISTPFSESCAKEIAPLMPFWKVPSGEITNYPFLSYLAAFRKPIVLSTGMSTLGEVEKAVSIIIETWGTKFPKTFKINNKELKPLSLLHCVSNYPASFESLNLRAIETLRKAFGTAVGYSDHTIGIEAPIAAVALGAEIIEKHFTLDKNMEGPDHKASLEPNELSQMVKAVRNIELAMGSGIKKPHISEYNALDVARKSIHFVKDMKKDTILTKENLILKRPGNGINAEHLSMILGRKLKKDVKKDILLNWNDLE